MSQVDSLVTKARQLEGTDNEEAAKTYLVAARLMIKDRTSDITEANKLFQKAKELKGLTTNPTKKGKGFSRIGGLNHLKEEIRFKVIEPFLNPQIFEMYGKDMGGGILMYGPPGCGKTLIAKATAEEVDAEFILVKSSEIESQYIGETQKNITKLFQNARNSDNPCILFFDEFDILGRDRSMVRHEYSKNKVSALLSEMDGLDSKSSRILMLAATNEPWAIDSALRREGRFGMSIYVPLPDKQARISIMRINMQGRPTGQLDFQELARKTEGFSGADITSICEKATDKALRKAINTRQRQDIGMQDFIDVISEHRSIIPEWFSKAKKQIRQQNMQDSFQDLLDAGKEIEELEMIRKGNLDYFLDKY